MFVEVFFSKSFHSNIFFHKVYFIKKELSTKTSLSVLKIFEEINSKMKPLLKISEVFQWFCMFDTNNDIKSKRITYFIFTSTGFIATIILLAASMTFFSEYVRIDLEEALYALCQIAVHSGVLYVFIVAFILRRRIFTIFESLSKIYELSEKFFPQNFKLNELFLLIIWFYIQTNTGENDESYRFLAQANAKSEKIWEAYFKYGVNGMFGSIIFQSLGTLMLYYVLKGSVVKEKLYRTYRIRWEIILSVKRVLE